MDALTGFVGGELGPAAWPPHPDEGSSARARPGAVTTYRRRSGRFTVGFRGRPGPALGSLGRSNSSATSTSRQRASFSSVEILRSRVPLSIRRTQCAVTRARSAKSAWVSPRRRRSSATRSATSRCN